MTIENQHGNIGGFMGVPPVISQSSGDFHDFPLWTIHLGHLQVPTWAILGLSALRTHVDQPVLSPPKGAQRVANVGMCRSVWKCVKQDAYDVPRWFIIAITIKYCLFNHHYYYYICIHYFSSVIVNIILLIKTYYYCYLLTLASARHVPGRKFR